MQIFQRLHAGRAKLFGIFVAQLIERKMAALRDFDTAHHGPGQPRVAASNFVQRAQMPLGIGKESRRGLGHGAAGANGAQNIMQGLPAWIVIVHIPGRDQRDMRRAHGARANGQICLSSCPARCNSARGITAIAEQLAISGQRTAWSAGATES